MMPNPFRKQEPVQTEMVEASGLFGCFSDDCGRVTGAGMYNEVTEMLFYTCPSGHKNEIRIKI